MDIFSTSISMLIAQVGARHLVFNFTDAQKKIITHPFAQGLILLGMFFVGTRNIYIALLSVSLYYLCVFILLNENHSMNILPRSMLKTESMHNEEKSSQSLYYENISRLP